MNQKEKLLAPRVVLAGTNSGCGNELQLNCWEKIC